MAQTSRWFAAFAVVTTLLASGCAGGLPSFAAPDIKHVKKDRADEALKEFESRRNEAEFKAASVSFQNQDISACHQHLDSLLSRDSRHKAARLLLVEVYLAEQSPENAISELQKLIADFPNSPEVHYSLAGVLEMTGNESEAETHYEMAQKLAPQSDLYRVSYEASLDESRNVSKLGTSDDKIAPGSALNAFATAKLPSPPLSHRIIPKHELDAAASSAVEESSPIPGEMSDFEDAPAFADAARTALQAGHPERAAQVARQGISSYPNAPSLHRIAGAAYLESGQLEAAKAAFDQAIRLDNTSAVSYFLLGCTYKKMGRVPDAHASFDQASRLDSRYAANY